MSANKSKILSLDEYRKQQIAKAAAPPAFDPVAIQQRIVRARVAPSAEERDLARELVVEDAAEMLRVLQVMGGEILTYRQQVRTLAAQASDTSTIIAVLLERAGGEVRVPLGWFRAYDPPAGSGFMVTEEDDEVVIRAIVVADEAPSGASLESAGQRTEGD